MVYSLYRKVSFGRMTGRIINGLAKHLDVSDDTASSVLVEIGREKPMVVTKALFRVVTQDPDLWQVVAKILASISVDADVIYEEWLGSRSVGPEAVAIRHLATEPDFASVLAAEVVDFMTSSVAIQRHAAVDVICRSGYRGDCERLLLAAANDCEPMVREAAITGIRDNRSWRNKLVFDLGKILYDHADSTVRVLAAQALGNTTKYFSWMNLLFYHAKRDDDEQVREASAQALAKLKARCKKVTKSA